MERALLRNALRIRRFNVLLRKRQQLRIAYQHVLRNRWPSPRTRLAWKRVNVSLQKVARRLLDDAWLFRRNVIVVQRLWPWVRRPRGHWRWPSAPHFDRVLTDAQVMGGHI